MSQTFVRKVAASTDAAQEAWRTSLPSGAIPPSVKVGVYIPQNPSGKVVTEIYTTISDASGDSVFYFARDRQIYAAVAFKCVKKRYDSGSPFYYEITPSVEDLEMGRSPLRPIGCKVNEKDPIASAVRLFAVDSVEPLVSKVFKATL